MMGERTLQRIEWKLKMPSQRMPKYKESAKNKRKFDIEYSSGNVFKDIGFDDDEAASLLVRAQLISALRDLIASSGLSQRQIAKAIGVQQPRIAEIMSMKTQLFSSDLLMKLLSRLGKRVTVVIEDSHRVA
jgi:predicted XRE-type DNA-binding protein